jgi:glycosyltransferase involved in cell wall biosynthesis
MKISVIIPTYQRPQFLWEAVKSVWCQTLLPCEIIIGDDSKNNETKQLVHNKLIPESKIPIRYWHNDPPLKQARNVDRLIQLATGHVTALLHDDDLFCPRALEWLAPCFVDPAVAVACGKQYVANEQGDIDREASEKMNDSFYRNATYVGSQFGFLESAILQQFPNDGFLIRSAVAKSVGYLNAEKIMGDACDQGFSILCAQAFPTMKINFVDQYTAIYRESSSSIARNNPKNDISYRSFKYVSRLPAALANQPRIDRWLREKSAAAVSQAAMLGDKQKARQWYFSKWHRGKILTLGGVRRAWMLV